MNGIPRIGDEPDDELGCMACKDRPARHLRIVDGHYRVTCCRCHILVDRQRPVPWHEECQELYLEQNRRGRVGHNLVVVRNPEAAGDEGEGAS